MLCFLPDVSNQRYGCSLPALKEMWPEGADSIMTIHKNPASAGATFLLPLHLPFPFFLFEKIERNLFGPLTLSSLTGTIFKQSMHELSKLLLSKDPFYVRCIKPNDSKAKNSWDNELCQHQVNTAHHVLCCVVLCYTLVHSSFISFPLRVLSLGLLQVRYLGLMENLKVRRAGYCNRQVYKQFVERYKMLAKKTWPNFRGDAKTAATHIIEETGLKSEVPGKRKLNDAS
jgi:myosin-1